MWSDSGNWDTLPGTGSNLVFPTVTANLTNDNDLTAGTSFGSLTLSGSGYTIGGNAIALTAAVDASLSSGLDTVNLPIGLSSASTVTVDQAAATLDLGGVISGSSGLTKAGAGVLNLSGANNYTGTTTISAGRLNVNNEQEESPVSVDAGATLGGSGTVGTITSNSGTVAPGGAAPAILMDSGDLNLGAGSLFTVFLNGTTAGNNYSQLSVEGQIQLGGATLNAAAGFTPSAGDQFTIISNAGSSPVSGTFAGLPEGAQLNLANVPYRISYQGGTDHRDVVLTSLDASKTTVTPSMTSISYGDPITLTATVAPLDPLNTTTPTGSVEFFSGTTMVGMATLSGGMATATSVVLPGGTDSVTAVYMGDGTFASSTSPAVTVNVTPAGSGTALMVAPTASVTGQPTMLTATVTGQGAGPDAASPSGTVEFFAVTASGMTSLGTATLSGGMATKSTNALIVADTSITAHYQGDGNFTPSDATAVPVMVTQADTGTALMIAPNPSGLNSEVTLTATVTASGLGTGTPTGMVNFMNGTSSLGMAPLVNGVATKSISTLPLGNTSIVADYEGDDNYAPGVSTAMTAMVLEASMTSLSANPTSTTFGQSTTLTATVAAATSGTGTPTGDVKFFNGNALLGTATLNNGTVALPVTTLPAGADAITAQYQGDGTFAASTSPIVTVTVAKATTAATVVVAPNPSTVGQQVTLTATVTVTPPGAGTPTGNVDFFNNNGTHLGSAPLGTNGTAALPNIMLPAGSNSITATYQGDSNFLGITSPAVTANVGQGTTTTLTGPTAPVVVGQTFSLTATVAPSSGTGTPMGNVQFFNGATSLGNMALTNGVAILTNQSFAAVNTYSLTATYTSSDTMFTGSTSQPLSVTVGQASTNTKVTVVPSPSNLGSAVTLTATVTAASPGGGTPTGSVEFFTGSTSLGAVALTNGVGVIASSNLVVGTNTITAHYRGDTNYVQGTSPPVTTNVLNTTTTTVSSSPSPSVFGQPVTLTAAVSSTAGTPTGVVQFLNGTTTLGNGTLSNGVASITTMALPVGADSITAAYLGDGTFAASTSAAITQTVSKATVTSNLSSSANPSGLGQGVTFTDTVSAVSPGAGLPTGTVQFFNGSVLLGTGTLLAGVATFSTPSLPVGTSSITATYPGDTNFLTNTSAVLPQTVGQGNNTVTVSSTKTNPVTTESIVLTATVAAVSPATGTPTGTVVFMSNGIALGSGTLSGGQATLTTSFASVGTQSVTAVYQGASSFTANTSAALSIVVGDGNELFLNSLYKKIFHAAVESTGLNTWQPLLADGMPRKQVVRQIVNSNSLTRTSTALLHQILGPKATVKGSHAKLVNSLYAAILGVPPTAQQLKFNVGLLNRGVSVKLIIIDLLSSKTFYVNAINNP
jgi:autotransporter-associated beta strand protein